MQLEMDSDIVYFLYKNKDFVSSFKYKAGDYIPDN
jgi:hypothetical protein